MIKETDLPEGWKIFKIKDILSFHSSGAWGDEADNSTGTPVLRSTNFTKNFKLNLDKIAYRKIIDRDLTKKKLQYGDLLLEKSGGGPRQPVGRVVFFDIQESKSYVCGNFIQLLRVNSECVNPKYLYYWLVLIHKKGVTNLMQNKTTGIRNLRLVDYLKINVPLPPLPTQKKIADILEKAEKLKKWRAEADKLTDEFLKSTFLEMFYKNSNYNNWKLVPIQELASSEKASMRTGPFGSNLKHSEFVESGIAVLGIDNVVKNRFQWAQRRYITKEKYREFKQYTVYPKDVLITIMGTTGKSCVVPNEIPLSISTKHLAVITCNNIKCEPSFLSYSIIFHPEILKQINRSNKGAIMEGLNLKIIKSLKMPLPPLPLQQKFAAIVRQVEQMRQCQQESKAHIDDLFNALMQKAFKGELVA